MDEPAGVQALDGFDYSDLVQDTSKNSTYMRVKYDEGKINTYEFSNLEKHRLTKRVEQRTSTICQVPETEYFGDAAVVIDICTSKDMQFDDQYTEWDGQLVTTSQT